MVDRLACSVMPYAWGSRTAIATLLGRPAPSDGPEAELWMGDHPMAPSSLVRNGRAASLADVIAEDPVRELGESTVRAFGTRLPFLLKVLAAAEPLSLQAHPNLAQAEAGFDEEERRGVSRTAPNRNYKDRSHKPELLSALGPFDALLGFRRIDDTVVLFDTLDIKELEGVLAPLRRTRDRAGLSATFRAILTAPGDRRTAMVSATVAACAKMKGVARDAFAKECAWTERLAALYPGDVGVISALLLNHVHLDPGEAIYLGAGKLHAYLGGVGVEIMASSDNVLRGGLTPKHVDVAELARVLDFEDGPITPTRARAVDDVEHVFDTPAREFRLSMLHLDRAKTPLRTMRGPEILLSTEAAVCVRTRDGKVTQLGRGACAFLAASTGSYTLHGEGTIFRATVNLA